MLDADDKVRRCVQILKNCTSAEILYENPLTQYSERTIAIYDTSN